MKLKATHRYIKWGTKAKYKAPGTHKVAGFVIYEDTAIPPLRWFWLQELRPNGYAAKYLAAQAVNDETICRFLMNKINNGMRRDHCELA